MVGEGVQVQLCAVPFGEVTIAEWVKGEICKVVECLTIIPSYFVRVRKAVIICVDA